ncbi:hypothetical protein KIW84_045263 [Lathyrus oleraceus]|uniref:Uncharacterized protein n=1 Tax=Pisum sativum TaxID=3888 RepID=A0A9D5AU04_PEA|nr:hypothetical protein KIW84_045263 [Pisum sativum]
MHDGCWKPIDSGEGSDAPLASLDVRGIKESHLHMMLQRIEISFKESIRRNVQNEVKRQNGDTVEKLKIEVVEIATDQDCGTDIYCPSSVLGRKLQLPCPSKFVLLTQYHHKAQRTPFPAVCTLEHESPLSTSDNLEASALLLKEQKKLHLAVIPSQVSAINVVLIQTCNIFRWRHRILLSSSELISEIWILVYQLKAYRCRMRFAWQQLALDFDLHSSYAPSFAVAADVTLIDLHADALLHSLLVDEIVAASFQTAETI